MPDQQLQPFGAEHELVVSLQCCVQLAAVDHHALLRLVGHLFERERVVNHVAGQLLSPFCIVRLNAHLVVNGKAGMLPGEEFMREILCDGFLFNQIVQHRMAQLLDQQL